MIDENMPHHARRDRQEMRAILPGDRFTLDQTHVRLVHEHRGLKRVSLVLAGQTAKGDAMEFPMYERNHLLESSLVATLPLLQECRYRRARIRNAAILVQAGPARSSFISGM